MNSNEFVNDDVFEWNMYTILNYIKVHYIQFILLIFVFIIIYTVERITNINAALYGITTSLSSTSIKANNTIIPKKIKNTKKIRNKLLD